MNITDEMIEAGARKLYETRVANTSSPNAFRRWEDFSAQDLYRGETRAVLETAMGEVEPEPLKDWGPYENAVYALIRMPETSPLLSFARDDDVAPEAIYFDALSKKLKGKAEVIEVEISNNPTGMIRDAVANATKD